MIIFLYGEDGFRSGKKVFQIKRKFLEKNPSKRGLFDIDFEKGKRKEISEIKETLHSGDLFSPKRLIVFRNLLINSNSEFTSGILEILEEIKDIEKDENTVIIFWEKKCPRKNNKLFKFLVKKSKSQAFENLDRAKLKKWIVSEIKNINPDVEIRGIALEKILVYCGKDLERIHNELEKLTNYKTKGYIEEEDIESLVKADINSNIFETIEALSSGDRKKASFLFHKQLESGEDPFYMLSMYVYQFRNLLKIGGYYWKGIRNQDEITRLSKLHPFIVTKGVAQVQRMEEKRIKNIYKSFRDIDTKSKTGKAEIMLSIDRLIARI